MCAITVEQIFPQVPTAPHFPLSVQQSYEYTTAFYYKFLANMSVSRQKVLHP